MDRKGRAGDLLRERLAKASKDPDGADSSESSEDSPSTRARSQSDPNAFGTDITKHFTLGKIIGKGSFAIVREAIDVRTGERVAVKVIEAKADPRQMAAQRKEVAIMLKVGSHPNIMKFYGAFEDKRHIYIVMQLVQGGELFDRIISRGRLTEDEAMRITKQLLEAVGHLHRNGIAHRDLKPQNILCADQTLDNIVLADFGLAKIFEEDNLITACGSPEYIAPEVFRNKPYTAACDIWAVGVIAYIM